MIVGRRVEGERKNREKIRLQYRSCKASFLISKGEKKSVGKGTDGCWDNLGGITAARNKFFEERKRHTHNTRAIYKASRMARLGEKTLYHHEKKAKGSISISHKSFRSSHFPSFLLPPVFYPYELHITRDRLILPNLLEFRPKDKE